MESHVYDREFTKRFREKVNLKQYKLAQLLGCPSSTIWRWENTGSSPDANFLGILFDLSQQAEIAKPLIWIPEHNKISLSPDQKPCTKNYAPRPVAWNPECVEFIKEQIRETQYGLAQRLSIPPSTVWRWIHSKAAPQENHLASLYTLCTENNIKRIPFWSLGGKKICYEC